MPGSGYGRNSGGSRSPHQPGHRPIRVGALGLPGYRDSQLFGFAFGFHETIYFALSMGFSDPRAAGTMYAIFMAMGNIGPVTGEPLMGNLAEGWGFIPTFYLFAAVNIVNLPLVAAMLRLKREQPQQ